MLDQSHGRSANNYPALGQMPFQKPRHIGALLASSESVRSDERMVF